MLPVTGGHARRRNCRQITKNNSDEWKIVYPARVLELSARPQKVVARAHRGSPADPGLDPDRNRRLRPRPFHLQFVLEIERDLQSEPLVFLFGDLE